MQQKKLVHRADSTAFAKVKHEEDAHFCALSRVHFKRKDRGLKGNRDGSGATAGEVWYKKQKCDFCQDLKLFTKKKVLKVAENRHKDRTCDWVCGTFGLGLLRPALVLN